MKKHIGWSLFSFLFIMICLSIGGAGIMPRAVAETTTSDTMLAHVLNSDDPFLSEQYLDIYSIPTENFVSTQTTGGEWSGQPLSYAFDRNFGTFYKAYIDNNINGFLNKIDVTFDKVYKISNILYQAENYYDGRGYPKTLAVYGNEGGEFVKVGEITTTPTNAVVRFELKTPVETDKIRLEWVDVNRSHNYRATAREIIFLTQENEAGAEVLDLFEDYSQTKLKENFANKESLDRVQEQAANLPGYEAHLKELFERANLVLNDTIKFDPRREFSSNPEAENLLERRGNVVSHIRNNLKIKWLGTNRMSTGISINRGQTLTIYVECDEGDKLPTLAYSQFLGHWSSWLRSGYQLKPGKNVITAASFENDRYSNKEGLIWGGPVYLENPYTEDEQSENVKVYIEGGSVFPVFHSGGDEGRYQLELKAFIDEMNQNPNQIVDCTEFVSNRVLITVSASAAYKLYQTNSAQKNLDVWDEYFYQILTYEGLELNPGQTHYDKKNDYINCNIRLMQPHGAAYAYTEHVGIQPDWESTAIVAGGFGWGYTHEFGHMMEIGSREIGECTNNMISKYYETAIEKAATRGNFDKTLSTLSPDNNLPESFFDDEERMNFLIWWYLESYKPGFWGELENHYRYTPVSGMTATEQQVYYSSLVLGMDMSYYYERWGYRINSNSEQYFKRGQTSAAFNTAMTKARIEGLIDENKQLKFWYLDRLEYLKRVDGQNTSCYTAADSVSITEIIKTGNGYFLTLSSQKSSDENHLGFEIIEGVGESAHVVGFTYSNSFVDTTVYPSSYTPQYYAVAYDRALNTSGMSEVGSIQNQVAVARLNQNRYNSLSEALVRAQSGDTIYLLSNVLESGIVIDKNITIAVDETVNHDIIIKRDDIGDMITINADVHLTLQGRDGARIILDGAGYAQKGTIIRMSGFAVLSHVVLQNNYNTKEGGAIVTDGNGGNRQEYLQATDVEFSNNISDENGGAVFNKNAYVNAVFTNCKFTLNRAKNYGAIATTGSFTVTSCQFLSNSASEDGGAIGNVSGGVMTITGSTISLNSAKRGGGLAIDGKTTISSCNITENYASTFGGGIFYSGSNGARELYVQDGTIITSNLAALGGAIYLSGNAVSKGHITGDAVVKSNGEGFGLYVNSGTLYIYQNCSIGENISRSKQGIVQLTKGLFTLASQTVELGTEDLKQGSQLLNSDFVISQAETEKFTVATGVVGLGEGGKGLVASIEEFTVTIHIGEQIETFKVSNQNKFWLSVESDDITKKVVSYTANGQTYEFGSEIVVTSDIELVAKLVDKKVITLNVGQEQHLDYVHENTQYNLPSGFARDVNVLYWESNGQVYLPYSSILVTDNMTFNAAVKSQFKVEYEYDNNVFETRYYSYGEYVHMPVVPNMPIGHEVNYWTDGEKTIESGYRITGDLKISAVLKLIDLQIKFVFSNGELYKSMTLPYGSTLTIQAPDVVPVGHEFDHIELDKSTIEAGAEIQVTKNIEVKYVLTTAMFDYTFKVGNQKTTEEVEYGSTRDVVYEGQVPEGKRLSHALVNGQRVELGEEIVITEDTIVEIVFEDIKVNITYMLFGRTQKIVRVNYGSQISLAVPFDIPNGYVFDHFVVDGINKALGSKITVKANTIIDVVLKEASEQAQPGSGQSSDQDSGDNTLTIVLSVLAGVILAGLCVTVLVVMKKKKKK